MAVKERTTIALDGFEPELIHGDLSAAGGPRQGHAVHTESEGDPIRWISGSAGS